MSHRKFFFSLIFCLAFFGFADQSFAQKRRIVPPRKSVAPSKTIITTDNAAELERRVETFLIVWQTVKNNYFDQTFNNLDWETIKKEYEPRVRQTTDDRQLYDILQEMVNRLGRSHFAIIPPEVYQAIAKAKLEAKARGAAAHARRDSAADDENAAADQAEDADYAGKYGIGVEWRLIDERFVITSVEANSTAARAGLKTGFIVEKINGVSLIELLKKLELYYSKTPNISKHLPSEIGNILLDGEKDSLVAVECVDGQGARQDFKVAREASLGTTISIGKNFPEQYLKFQTVAVGDDVGLIKFNVFALPVVEKFCRALTEFKNKKAIIIDLRGNGGGILGTLIALGGMLTDDSIDLGTSIYKVGRENLQAHSKAKNYAGKIVFLVDGQTISAAEIFAAALKENNRAVVVGEKTAGEALPAISLALPTKAVFYYPIANYLTHNGTSIEGKGLEPDITISLDRASLLAGTDAQLAAALKIIGDDTTFPKAKPTPLASQTDNAKSPPPPQPPPPAAKVKPLATVTVNSPPPPAKTPESAVSEDKAREIINTFALAVGGRENFDKINSYTLQGTTELTAKGTTTDLAITIYRQRPDKYSEIWRSDAIGEIRQVYNSSENFFQSDFGIVQPMPAAAKAADVEIFAAIRNVLDENYFTSLKFSGIFDRRDRKTQVIEATTKTGEKAALAFDRETGLLTAYIVGAYGFTFDDYRKVENLRLPFAVERDGYMKIKFDAITINSAPAAEVFAKKINCYDKAN